MKPLPAPRPGNVPGRFYVNNECITCAVCADVAPAHFRLGDDDEGNIVFSQPQTEAEIASCRDALEGCPVEAITDADPRWP